MVKAATMVGLLFAAAVVIPLACSPFGGASAFTCDQDADCQGAQQGRCELTTGFCAFADDSCGPLGRYGELSGALSGQCVEGSTQPDAQDPDGPPVDPEDVCFGTTGGLVEPCFDPAELPANAVAFTATTTIDTDTSTLCSAVVKNTTACVIAGPTVTLNAGVTVRAIGGKPLVLLATTGAVQIDGVLDAASHVTSLAEIAAGGNDNNCDPGTAAGTSAGGGGGSHGALGGRGGNGIGVANSGGVPGAASGAVTSLRGGCKGQDGKEGSGGAASRGLGGNGGGAVYVIGETAIVLGVAGRINASGSGATGGISGSAGGGGGGSGGTIGIDAPTLTNGGQIFTHGGGGGAGSGTSGAGGPGGDPTIMGGAGGIPGGAGAPGGAGGTTAAGTAGTGSATRGGGGGGGGTGVIRLFGGAAANGQISPGPT